MIQKEGAFLHNMCIESDDWFILFIKICNFVCIVHIWCSDNLKSSFYVWNPAKNMLWAGWNNITCDLMIFCWWICCDFYDFWTKFWSKMTCRDCHFRWYFITSTSQKWHSFFQSISIFGRNCHTKLHFLGEFNCTAVSETNLT